MYFPSKKDRWLSVIIWGTILAVIYRYIAGEEPIGWSILIAVLVIGFLLWMWFGTGYKIEGGRLQMKCGPFKSTVNTKEITKLRATKNPISAPALSLDRLEITYGTYQMAIVSPKHKGGFIRLLLQENPHIEVDANLKS